MADILSKLFTDCVFFCLRKKLLNWLNLLDYYKGVQETHNHKISNLKFKEFFTTKYFLEQLI